MFPKNSKMLVVDDQVNMRNVLTYTLNEIGYHNIISTDSAFSALDIILESAKKGEPFDIIFSDWNMPDMSGYDLLKSVKKSDLFKETFFVLVTTVAEKDKIIKSIKLGLNEYIIKPYKTEDIRKKIEKLHEFKKKKRGEG